MSKLKSYERLCLDEQTHITSRPNKVINRAKKKSPVAIGNEDDRMFKLLYLHNKDID